MRAASSDSAGDVIALLENQVQATLDDAEVGTVEKARCIGYLASVTLRAIERFEQLALLNPNQVPRLAFNVPKLHMRQDFQRRAVAILQPSRTRSYTANTPGRAPKKTHQTVRLA
jgi:hypothetical protein